MNHPKPEEWAPYLFGEIKGPRRRQLRAHLRACVECRGEMASWKRTLGRLDAWQLPGTPPPAFMPAPAFWWAAAAALVLGIGFLAGRWSRPTEAQIATLVRQEAKAQARQELKADLLAALAPGTPRQVDAFQRQLRQQVQTVLSRAGRSEAFNAALAEDRRTTLALLERMAQQQADAYVSLRRDLETLATAAADGLQQNGRQIVQLESVYRPGKNHQ